LNENARGVISGMLMPQIGHAIRRENKRSPPLSVLIDDDVVGELEARSIGASGGILAALTISRSTARRSCGSCGDRA
jgi:hypothetical protein